MSTTEMRPPLGPGQLAPDFTLPAVQGAETVSLSDYRGKSSVFLALMLGLWCPFCRRSIARINSTEGKLKAHGVETLCVVATPPENARLYFKFRPTKLRLGADPELTTHRAYGVPKPEVTPELMDAIGQLKVNPNGELPEALPVQEAAMKLGQMDGYQGTPVDEADMGRQWPQMKAQYLIDRDGVIRWANIECADGMENIGRFPTDEEILEALKTLPR
jgi:peroxiredoxin